MSAESRQMDLTCPACSHAERCGYLEMVARLQLAGTLRRSRDPDPDLVQELFVSTAIRFTCMSCGHEGLKTREASNDEWDEWGLRRSCEGCGSPIDRERLQVLPDARLCSKCQQKDESGSSREVEYCPRCGEVMRIRLANRGIIQYVMACPKCGKAN